jgi:putative transposase
MRGMALEVTDANRAKLDVPEDRKRDLHATNDTFLYCANCTAAWTWHYRDEDCVSHHQRIYKYQYL